MEIFLPLLCLSVLAILIFMAFISLVIYFIPVIIAYIRKHDNFIAICLLNIFTGWTFLGWLASLFWSLNSDIGNYKELKEDDE